MNFNADFIPLALRTESQIAPITLNKTVFDAVLDACVNIGELADFIKKKAAYNKPIDLAKWNDYVKNLESILPFIAELTDDSFVGSEVIDVNTRLFHGIIGQFTESTELVQAMQVAIEEGKWDYTNLKEEIGDTQWYQAILVDELKGNMEDIQQVVINKLQKRYPEKYSDAAAIDRDVVAERVVLEAGV